MGWRTSGDVGDWIGEVLPWSSMSVVEAGREDLIVDYGFETMWCRAAELVVGCLLNMPNLRHRNVGKSHTAKTSARPGSLHIET